LGTVCCNPWETHQLSPPFLAEEKEFYFYNLGDFGELEYFED